MLCVYIKVWKGGSLIRGHLLEVGIFLEANIFSIDVKQELYGKLCSTCLPL